MGASKPLFIEDTTTLLDLLKLNQLEEEGSTLQIAEDVIRDVTVAFHRRLGKARVDVLKALTFTDPPVTDNDFLAVLARITERKWVKLKLMEELPTYFANPNNQTNVYNEEAPYLEDTTSIFKVMKKLEAEIEENLQFLAGEESAGSETSMKTFISQPAIEPPLPGDTAWGS